MHVAESSSGNHSGRSNISLTDIAQSLVNESLTEASKCTYNRALQVYKSFLSENPYLPASMPITAEHYLFFIAHCYIKQLAASTITTYISALSYVHKLHSLPDFSSNFLVKKCLHGYGNSLKTPDKRLPITSDMLEKLVASVEKTCTGLFIRTLIRAMFLLAFHAFLRVGELTNNKGKPPTLSYSDITFKDFQSGQPALLEVQISNFKHSKGRSVLLAIKGKADCKQFCPVKALWQFVCMRGSEEGPLFIFLDGTFVSRSFFSEKLRQCLVFCGYDTKVYKGHSFRIGAASTAASMGMSESMIQEMGRWKSSAFKKYIRINSFLI